MWIIIIITIIIFIIIIINIDINNSNNIYFLLLIIITINEITVETSCYFRAELVGTLRSDNGDGDVGLFYFRLRTAHE